MVSFRLSSARLTEVQAANSAASSFASALRSCRRAAAPRRRPMGGVVFAVLFEQLLQQRDFFDLRRPPDDGSPCPFESRRIVRSRSMPSVVAARTRAASTNDGSFSSTKRGARRVGDRPLGGAFLARRGVERQQPGVQELPLPVGVDRAAELLAIERRLDTPARGNSAARSNRPAGRGAKRRRPSASPAARSPRARCRESASASSRNRDWRASSRFSGSIASSSAPRQRRLPVGGRGDHQPHHAA